MRGGEHGLMISGSAFSLLSMGAYLETTKPAVSALSAFSAVAGYLAAGGAEAGGVLAAGAGFLLTAAGASAFNHVQDRNLDAAMPRTCHRPIPSGRVRSAGVFVLAMAFVSGGILLLGARDVRAALAGLGGVVVYNGIYAFLKRRSALATPIGALAGLAAPAGGWLLGGGALHGPAFSGLLAVFYLWQIPHFLIHAMRYGSQYASAGLPGPAGFLTRSSLARLSLIWFLAAVVAASGLPLFGLMRVGGAWVGMTLCGVSLLGALVRLLRNADGPALGRAFRLVTVFAVLLHLWLVAGAGLPLLL